MGYLYPPEQSQAQMEHIRARLVAAQHRADNGANIGVGGGADTIAASIARLHL